MRDIARWVGSLGGIMLVMALFMACPAPPPPAEDAVAAAIALDDEATLLEVGPAPRYPYRLGLVAARKTILPAGARRHLQEILAEVQHERGSMP